MNYVTNAYTDDDKEECIDWMQYLKYFHPH